MLIAFCVQSPAIFLHSAGKFPSCYQFGINLPKLLDRREKISSKRWYKRRPNVAILSVCWCFCITIIIWLLSRLTPVFEHVYIRISSESFLFSSEILTLSEGINCFKSCDHENQMNCADFKSKFYGQVGKRKFSHSRVTYYSNSVASRQMLLLSGDI